MGNCGGDGMLHKKKLINIFKGIKKRNKLRNI